NLQDGIQVLVTDSMQVNLADNITAMATAVFRWRDNVFDGNSNQIYSDTWVSAGVRPILHTSQHTAIAAELGVDNVNTDNELVPSGSLVKLSVAPMIKAGKGFWDRPEIRAYATVAYWTDEFKGTTDEVTGNATTRVGGLAHVDRN